MRTPTCLLPLSTVAVPAPLHEPLVRGGIMAAVRTEGALNRREACSCSIWVVLPGCVYLRLLTRQVPSWIVARRHLLEGAMKLPTCPLPPQLWELFRG